MSMVKFATRPGEAAASRCETGGLGLSAWLGQVGERLGVWRARIAARRSLAAVSARDLRDAGLSPSQAQFEIRQPFWRPLNISRN